MNFAIGINLFTRVVNSLDFKDLESDTVYKRKREENRLLRNAGGIDAMSSNASYMAENNRDIINRFDADTISYVENYAHELYEYLTNE